MLRIVLLAISSLSLLGCAPNLPEFPEVTQCGYSIKFNKWRCVNSRTKAAENRDRNDPRMEGAQALSADDYQASQAWVAEITKLAERRCR
jgi:hypothetical protein